MHAVRGMPDSSSEIIGLFNAKWLGKTTNRIFLVQICLSTGTSYVTAKHSLFLQTLASPRENSTESFGGITKMKQEYAAFNKISNKNCKHNFKIICGETRIINTDTNVG